MYSLSRARGECVEEAGSPGFIVTQELQHCSVVADLRVLLLFKEYCYSLKSTATLQRGLLLFKEDCYSWADFVVPAG